MRNLHACFTDFRQIARRRNARKTICGKIKTLGHNFVCICCIAALTPYLLCKRSKNINVEHNKTRHLPPHRRKRKTTKMAFITENRTATVSLADRFAAFAANLSAAYARRKLYNTTFHELNALSNRDLADLGIHRSMIKSIALEASAK